MRFLEGMLIKITKPSGSRFGVVRECKSFDPDRDDLVWADWKNSAKEALQAPESHESVSVGGSLSYYTQQYLERKGYKILSHPDLKPFEDWL